MEQRITDRIMPAAKNRPDDIRIRKFRDILVTGGLAVVAFGVWTVIRGVLEMSKELGSGLSSMTYEGLSEAEVEEIKAMMTDTSLLYGLLGLVIGLTIVDLAIRIYVGLSARSVGLQKKNKKGKEKNGIIWIILGFLLVAVGVCSFVYTLLSVSDTLKVHSIFYFAVQVFAEGTSLFITAELVITGIRLRGLTKKQQELEEVRDAA